MTWVGTAVAASTVYGAYSANKAAGKQADAMDRAAELQNQQYQDTVRRQQPFYDVGVNALPELVEASKYTPFGMGQFQADPGYAFRLSEGQKALERSAAARGGLLSGGTGKALQRFGQEMGSQEYTNAFNRYQTERAARLNPLQSLTGMGQTTANTIGQAGQTMASNVGDAMGSAAAARASGYVGGANALTSGLGSYLNYSQGQNYLNALRGSGGNSPTGYTPTTDFSTGADYGFSSNRRL
jgi:hypothetical protein